jgi:hypothetical protein
MSDWRQIMGAHTASAAVDHAPKTPKPPPVPTTKVEAPTHTQKTFNSQNSPSNPSFVDKMYVSPTERKDRAGPPVIEMIFKACGGEAAQITPEFPPCPECGAARYWVSRGFLRCGSKKCDSAPRFALVAISYSPIN